MSKQIDLKEFKERYRNTIKTDPKHPDKRFIELPIEDYGELEHMRYYIANAIGLVATSYEMYCIEPVEWINTTQVLTTLLKRMQTISEAEGMDLLSE